MGTGRLEPLAAAFVVGVPLLKPGGKPGSSGGQMPGPAADIALGIDGVARGYYRKESPCRLGVREWRGVYSALAVQGGTFRCCAGSPGPRRFAFSAVESGGQDGKRSSGQ